MCLQEMPTVDNDTGTKFLLRTIFSRFALASTSRSSARTPAPHRPSHARRTHVAQVAAQPEHSARTQLAKCTDQRCIARSKECGIGKLRRFVTQSHEILRHGRKFFMAVDGQIDGSYLRMRSCGHCSNRQRCTAYKAPPIHRHEFSPKAAGIPECSLVSRLATRPSPAATARALSL
jgi:hypothetical protein